MSAAPAAFSYTVGGKISTYPEPFTKAEKLDTQNGMRNSLKVTQRSGHTQTGLVCVLMSKAAPMMPLSPNDVSHKLGVASK